MFDSILIANRGEIAGRIIRTARRMGIRTVAIYSDADRSAQHVAMADDMWRVGPDRASLSYLNIDRIIDIAQAANVDAIHPGYGFLSENAEFAERCAAAGLVFIGPSANAIRLMGEKDNAKRQMEMAGVAVVPGYHRPQQDMEKLLSVAEEIGFPLLIKASLGGGGRGIRRVDHGREFAAALQSARREAMAGFGNDAVLIEKLIAPARHIEIQIFADNHGHIVHLFERDCSLQRRRQKVLEEAPAPGMPPSMRAAMGRVAVQVAAAVDYRGAGTVEFIADVSDGLSEDRFYFMEMNTRLQVEHPVTEAITGSDLVEWQLRVAAGEALPMTQSEISISGHAIEARLYAEEPAQGFLPATGTLYHLELPDEHVGIRVDSGVAKGDVISSHYDPMLAKLIAHGVDRPQALSRLQTALAAVEVVGCATNARFLTALLAQKEVVLGAVSTDLVEDLSLELSGVAALGDEAWVFAALYSLSINRTSDLGDRWARNDGWRSWGEAVQYIRLSHQHRQQEVVLRFGADNRLYITVSGHEYAVMMLPAVGSYRWRAEIDDRIHSATVIPINDGLLVHGSGYQATFRVGADDESQTAADGDSRPEIVAPLSGRVVAVKVSLGDRVGCGDLLLTIEAMKIELAVNAPHTGIVAQIRAVVGEQVVADQVLIVLQPVTEAEL